MDGVAVKICCTGNAMRQQLDQGIWSSMSMDLVHPKQVIFSTIGMHNILDMLHGEKPETLLTYPNEVHCLPYLLTYLCRSPGFSTKLRSFLGITFLLMILPTFFLNFPRWDKGLPEIYKSESNACTCATGIKLWLLLLVAVSQSSSVSARS